MLQQAERMLVIGGDPARGYGVGCINSISCCGGSVFVDESAEQIASSDRHR
jgi:hypothetical protein